MTLGLQPISDIETVISTPTLNGDNKKATVAELA